MKEYRFEVIVTLTDDAEPPTVEDIYLGVKKEILLWDESETVQVNKGIRLEITEIVESGWCYSQKYY